MKRTGSFRLVHALVLAALIAMGIAWLIPTIQRMREQANLTLCKDHLRRLGEALAAYGHGDGGDLPVSATVQNPHMELTIALAGRVKDESIFYCPSLKQPEFSAANFNAGTIGYYYYSAQAAGSEALSKFLRSGVSWPRELNTGMDGKTWVMSDIWVSGLPTSHGGYRKGLNYLMLDGSVDFIGESPRQAFH